MLGFEKFLPCFFYQSWKLTCAYLLILFPQKIFALPIPKAFILYFFRAKDQVKERIDTLSASINAPSAPSEDVVDTVNQNGHLTTEDQLEILSHDDGNPWEDVKELLVLEDSKYMLVVCDTVNWKCFPRWFLTVMTVQTWEKKAEIDLNLDSIV